MALPGLASHVEKRRLLTAFFSRAHHTPGSNEMLLALVGAWRDAAALPLHCSSDNAACSGGVGGGALLEALSSGGLSLAARRAGTQALALFSSASGQRGVGGSNAGGGGY